MAFKMKRSPIKGKLSDFFKGLGNQLKRNRRDIGGEFKGVKQKDKPGGFGSLTDVDKDGISDFIQSPKKAPKGQETVSTKAAQPKKAKKQTFKQAFAAARKAGKKTFSWSGNSYTTKLAKNKKKKTTTTPKVKKGSINDINFDGIDDSIQGITTNR
jgi:hypothetical protein